MDHNKLWKILKEMRIPRPSYLPPEKLYVGQEVTELDMGQQTISKLGKKCVKALYCYIAYLAYMQSTSCKMLGWMNHRLESRLPVQVDLGSNNLRYADDTTLKAES